MIVTVQILQEGKIRRRLTTDNLLKVYSKLKKVNFEKQEVYLKVIYEKDLFNEGIYTTLTEVETMLRAATDKDLIKMLVQYETFNPSTVIAFT